MKLLNPKRSRQSGMALWIAIILFLAFLVFIGTVVYVIVKAIQRLFPAPPPDDPDNQSYYIDPAVVESARSDLQAQLATDHPGENVSVQVVDAYWVTAFVPFGPVTNAPAYPTNAPITVERSTNLLDWEVVGTVTEGEQYYDTNQFPQAFYRTLRDSQPVVFPASTNTPPGFYNVRLLK